MSKGIGYGDENSEFFSFSLNKPANHVKFACLIDGGGLVVGNGRNNGLVPMVADPQCEVLPAFMPDVFSLDIIQEKCAPVGDCKSTFGNCHATLEDCLNAPWEPLDDWKTVYPDRGDDPLAPAEPQGSSSACEPVGCSQRTISSGGGVSQVYEGNCPPLEMPDCASNVDGRTLYRVKGAAANPQTGEIGGSLEETGMYEPCSGLWITYPTRNCPSFECVAGETFIGNGTGDIVGKCVVDMRRADCMDSKCESPSWAFCDGTNDAGLGFRSSSSNSSSRGCVVIYCADDPAAKDCWPVGKPNRNPPENPDEPPESSDTSGEPPAGSDTSGEPPESSDTSG